MNDPLHAKRIVLGIAGGIAAYKTPELVRQLKKGGAEVQVVLTAAGAHFVTPLTLQAVSGMPVRQELFDPASEAGMDHIALAHWADALVIAPATADLIARLAHGMSNDLLSTLVLASPRPPLLAPAMNQQMWRHAATQRNLRQVQADGARLLGPAVGDQACGDVGPGRMLEAAEIVAHLRLHLAPQILAGRRALVTAGPTWEALDPARGISNRSSGKQGYAVAQALREAGAEVVLVSGPSALPAPPGVARVCVESAAEMLAAVEEALPGTEIFVAAAAVADHGPARSAARKMSKQEIRDALPLSPTPDILARVARHPLRPRLVLGFAAQTHDVLDLAAAKREAKGADMMLVNDVSQKDTGFGTEDNHLILIDDNGTLDLGRASKITLARRLAEIIRDKLS